MANENEIPLNIVADASDAEREISSFQKTAEKSIGGVVASIAKIAAGFASAAAVVATFKHSISEAVEAKEGFDKLNFALATTGEYSTESSEKMAKFASDLQKVTVFSDEAAVEALTLAKNFGLTNEQAKDLVKTASNVASQLGESLPASTERLIASLNGNSKALAPLGPQYKRLTEEANLAGEGVRLAGKQFAGAAEIFAGTFSGALQQAKNNFGDIFEEIGKAIIQNPLLTKSIQVLSFAFAEFADKIKDNASVISDFVSGGIKLLANALLGGIDAFESFNKSLKDLTFDDFIKGAGFAASAIGGFFLVFKSAESIEVILKIGAALETMTAALNGFTLAADVGLLTKISTAFTNIKTAVGLALFAFGELLIAALPFVAIAGAIALAAVGIDALQASIRGVPSVLDQVTGKFAATNDEIEDFSKFLDNGKIANKKFAQSTDDVNKSLKGELEALIGVSVESDRQEEALRKISEAAKASAAAFGKTREEALKYYKDVQKDSADAYAKLDLQLQDDLEKTANYYLKKALDLEQFNALRTFHEQTYFKKLKELRDKDEKEVQDQRKAAQAAIDEFNAGVLKAAQERKSELEGIIKDPAKALVESISGVNINFSSIIDTLREKFSKPIVENLRDLSDALSSKNFAAVGLGITSAMLEGAKGAQKFLAAGVGAAAELALPGIGAAVSQIADQLLTLGPDGAKTMIREFVDALPDLIIKLADSIPAVVEAMVDSLINKGGIVRIAVALLRALSGEAAWRAIGKQIGGAVTDEIKDNISGVADEFAGSVNYAGLRFSRDISGAFKNINLSGVGAQIAGDFIGQLREGMAGFGGSIADEFRASLGDLSFLRNAIGDSANYMRNVISSGIGDAANGMQDSIRRAIGDSANYMQDRLRTALGDSAEYLKDKIKEALSFGGGGGGGGGVLSGLGLATGGLVPPGYPNDTFPARLTSGELVIPKDLVTSLADFIDVGIAPRDSGSDVNSALLARIANLLAQPINVESNVSVSGQAFADIMLKLSRNNARLAV